MKTISLHLPSVAAGAGLAALVLLTLGAAPQATQLPHAAEPGPIGAMASRPHPRDFVWLDLQTPTVVVPNDRILVLTGTGRKLDSGSSTTRITVDGVLRHEFQYIGRSGFTTFSVGFTVEGGSTVEIGGPGAYAVGYLFDA